MTQASGVVRPMTEADLAMVLSWRNHAEVRRYMFSQHEIGMEEHRRWFAKACVDPNRRLLIFEQGREALGYVSFQRLHAGPVVDWGFYVSADAPRGTGSALGNAALAHAFDHERFHKVCGQAFEGNTRSIQLHLRLGFVQEGMLREQYFDGAAFHSVACFGLLQREWQLAAATRRSHGG